MAAPLKAEVVNAFLEPVLKVLKDCTGIDGGAPQLQWVSELPPSPCISVLIEVRGRLFGPVLCTFDPPIARHLAGSMLSSDVLPAFESEECKDAVSELANIIIGNATGALREAGYQVEISPPLAQVRQQPTAERLAERTLNVTVPTELGNMTLLIGVHPGQ